MGYIAIVMKWVWGVVITALSVWAVLDRRRIKRRLEAAEQFRDMMRKAHGEPCQATAVVVPSPSAPPVETGEPEPEPEPAMRGALLPDSHPSSVAPSTPGAIRRRVEAEEDERRARLDAAKGAPVEEVSEDARRTVEVPKLPSANEAEDDGDRETPEERTRLYKRSEVPIIAKSPTPHAPPRPIKSKRSTRGGPTRAAQLRADGMGAEEARRQAEEEGRIANASPGARHDRPSYDTLVSPGNAPPREELADDGSVIVDLQHEDGSPVTDREGPKR